MISFNTSYYIFNNISSLAWSSPFSIKQHASAVLLIQFTNVYLKLLSRCLLFVMFQGDRVLRRRSPGLEVSNLKIWVINLSVSISLNITPINIWGKVFKNGLNKFCGRQPLKNLLSPLVNTLSHVSLKHQKLTPKLLGCLRRY